MSHAIYRAAELIVRAWVRLYLVGVPHEARRQRRAEIASDLYEYRRDVHEQGRSTAAAALRLLALCIAGSLDDLLWRSEVGGALGGTSMLRTMPAPVRVAIATGVLLLVPLVAKLLFDEMAWSLFDFVSVGVLLFGAGLTFELVTKQASDIPYRLAVGVAVATALLLFFVNGAVGIIGSEDNPANLMYIGVLAVGIGGAIITRFRPPGMARTLFATAIAQALVAVIALIAVQVDPSFWGEPIVMQDRSLVSQILEGHPSPVLQILGVNGMFIALFLGSSWLFRTAARANSRRRTAEG